MIDHRLLLHDILCKILGSSRVYFQPPESKSMEYPAIVYSLKGINNDKAGNDNYIIHKRYSLVLMDKNPDNAIVDKLSMLNFCTLTSTYTIGNLNHYVFEIYF